MTIKEAVQATGIKEYTLRQWIKAGRVPHMRTGLGTGKIILDCDLLKDFVQREMTNNIIIKPEI